MVYTCYIQYFYTYRYVLVFSIEVFDIWCFKQLFELFRSIFKIFNFSFYSFYSTYVCTLCYIGSLFERTVAIYNSTLVISIFIYSIFSFSFL